MEKLIKDFLNGNSNKHLSIAIIIGDKHYKYNYNKDGLTNDEYEYFIGSITKTFTAHLVTKYIIENKIDLNTSCGVYLGIGDDFPTIKELLYHKAGYNHFTPYEIVVKNLLRKNYCKENIYFNIQRDDVIKLLKKRRKRKNIKYNYSYSDFNYAILGCVLSSVAEVSLISLFNDFLKNDLKLNNTYISNNKELTSVYKNKLVKSWLWNDDNPYLCAGGIISNVSDLLTYMDIQLKSTDKMISDCHIIDYSKKDKELIGRGWHFKKNNKHLWHVGGVGTHRSSIIISKNKGIAVAVLCNSLGKRKSNCHYICKKIYSSVSRYKNKIINNNYKCLEGKNEKTKI